MLNGPDLRWEHVQEAGAGDRATGSQCETGLSSNLIILLIFSCFHGHTYLKIGSLRSYLLMALDEKIGDGSCKVF